MQRNCKKVLQVMQVYKNNVKTTTTTCVAKKSICDSVIYAARDETIIVLL